MLPLSPWPSGQQESHTAAPSVERLIGELAAAAACLVAQGLGECWNRGRMDGEMSAATKQQGGALIAGLVELRDGTAGELDFDRVARAQGVQVLRARGGDVSDKTLNSLVDVALDVLGRIVRMRLH
jgi:hypothetical protein